MADVVREKLGFMFYRLAVKRAGHTNPDSALKSWVDVSEFEQKDRLVEVDFFLSDLTAAGYQLVPVVPSVEDIERVARAIAKSVLGNSSTWEGLPTVSKLFYQHEAIAAYKAMLTAHTEQGKG